MKNKIYFPNLNGLRFIAATLVLFFHLAQFRHSFYLSNFFLEYNFFSLLGPLGVILFFVLSGFLIVYLLLAEEKEKNTIKIKKFYIRRVLRIWPLYYIIVLLAFFILYNIPFFQISFFTPAMQEHYVIYLFLFIFFLPQVVSSSFGVVIPYAGQAWSIGVEEQFYMFIPLLFKYVENKWKILFGIIAFYFIVKFAILFTLIYFPIQAQSLDKVNSYWLNFPISSMAIGGLFSCVLFYKKRIIYYFFNPILVWIVLIFTIILVSYGIQIPYINNEFYSILFGIIIINLAASPKPIMNLENRLLNNLGKLSYGLYMYHTIIIVLVIKFFNYLYINNFVLQLISVLLLTFLLSLVSYNLIEKKFIKRKKKYSEIISGDNV